MVPASICFATMKVHRMSPSNAPKFALQGSDYWFRMVLCLAQFQHPEGKMQMQRSKCTCQQIRVRPRSNCAHQNDPYGLKMGSKLHSAYFGRQLAAAGFHMHLPTIKVHRRPNFAHPSVKDRFEVVLGCLWLSSNKWQDATSSVRWHFATIEVHPTPNRMHRSLVRSDSCRLCFWHSSTHRKCHDSASTVDLNFTVIKVHRRPNDAQRNFPSELKIGPKS